MGSGGSHKLLGSFVPTTRTTKDDSQVEIGTGQNKATAINSKLKNMAIDQSVQAVFLNEEHYYDQKPPLLPTQKTLRFLGYYVFYESRYTNGEGYMKIAEEFNQPSPNVFQHLTFRLHPHLRVEAKPFIPSIIELDQLTKVSECSYKKIVIEHNDHSNIYFDCVREEDWKTYHHKVTIKDIILRMIASGEINRHTVLNSAGEKSTR
jgi:hypothetical protein